MANTWRNVPERDRVILWARAAGRCCFPNCRLELIEPATSVDRDAIYGQAAHIVAHSSGGSRSDNSFPQEKLDKYENLVLLCGNHHTIVDKQPNFYTVEDLLAWKSEHENWVRTKTAPDKYEPLNWQVIFQEDGPQINESDALSVLPPDRPDKILYLKDQMTNENWDQLAKLQRDKVCSLIGSTAPKDRRFVVYSLARIPLAIHLGYIVSDRCRLVPFQFHRTTGRWSWPNNAVWKPDFKNIEIQSLKTSGDGPVTLRVSISASVSAEQAAQTVPHAIGDVHLSVEGTSVEWLQSREQLEALMIKYRDCFKKISETFGNRCDGIHVFYAGPTGGAINLGRSINLKMCPPITIYEYDRNSMPQYRTALKLRVE